ncbi:MAG: hypothetical protein J7L55_05665 [Desulfurococcales archaeon]|nr:hypothetical protein [Desulfurococcales archaeon]
MGERSEYDFLIERSRRFFESALMQIGMGSSDSAAFSLKHNSLRQGFDYPERIMLGSCWSFCMR